MALGKLIVAMNLATQRRNMSVRPLVSVCIPCYNGAEFLGRTIESVLGQYFIDFELVLADDKSTDRTVSVIRGFKDPRIKLIQNQTNLGLASNWTHVLSQSVGKYVKLLCEDDLLHPDCLKRQVAVLENPGNSRVVLAICNRAIINHRDEVVLDRKLRSPSGLVDGPSLVRKSVKRGTNLIGEPAVGLFRRDALNLRTALDANNPYLSDLALWAQLLRHGDAFLDPDCLAAFRLSPAAASTKIGWAQAACFRRFARGLLEDRCFRITRFDVLSASILSLNWCLFRNLFIRFHPRPPVWLIRNRPRLAAWHCATAAAKSGVVLSAPRLTM